MQGSGDSDRRSLARRTWERIPRFILVLFAVELYFAVAFVLVRAFGFGTSAPFLRLSGENTLATWFSTVQLAAVGVVLLCVWRARTGRALGTLLLGLAFLFLSMDEMVGFHERFGHVLETVVGPRAGSVLPRSGPWVVAVAPVVIGVLAVGVYLGRDYLRSRRGPATLFGVGTIVYIGSFAGLEVLRNFAPPGSVWAVLALMAEEIGEMVGATLMLWASFELLRAEGVRPVATPPAPQPNG